MFKDHGHLRVNRMHLLDVIPERKLTVAGAALLKTDRVRLAHEPFQKAPDEDAGVLLRAVQQAALALKKLFTEP